jgi:N-acetylglucosaminyldiphosphoundecaprenol N-acetyl-beta-D-mannosaminyltransferase
MSIAIENEVVTQTTSMPSAVSQLKFPPRHENALSVFGVGITNIDEQAAIDLIEQALNDHHGSSRAIYFVNAHTLNTSYEDSHYRYVLNQAFRVFGDGTGVRWAARAQGVKMRANLNGTDLIPKLFQQTAGRGYKYYMLGADEASNQRAADYARRMFPGWELVGHHHGYVQGDLAWPMIEEINRVQPDLLLVGMGNPIQERWIHHHLDYLSPKLCIGVGGLFNHWAGDLKRAPRWVRYLGYEWLQILLQQPQKWRRYLLGNPLYLARVAKLLKKDRQQTRDWLASGGK